MSVIHDRSDVARILDDPAWLVPEAVPGASPFRRLRGGASRFVNGPAHDERRARLESRLAELDPASLGRAAAAATRELLAADVDPAEAARQVPVRVLAAALDAPDPVSAPVDAAALAAPYATGVVDPDADAVDRAAARRLGPDAAGHRRASAVLDAQLLVQAHAATGGLVVEVLRRAAGSPGVPTRQLIETVLRDAPPVRSTRRVAPAAGSARATEPADAADRLADRLVELRLDGPDREATGGAPPRALAFGAGPRRCPASGHAIAIAAAVVDVLRESAC
ncbi:hypothetical protein [Agromyces sp. NPDC058104]|uniref:hypothetical protein n=1 Tax=Agromyces sp. NPDC058104 TaxID=3346342 RepID=UPI0036DED44D